VGESRGKLRIIRHADSDSVPPRSRYLSRSPFIDKKRLAETDYSRWPAAERLSMAYKGWLEGEASRVKLLSELDPEVAEEACEAFGSPTRAAKWLTRPNPGFLDAEPVRICTSERGRKLVLLALMAVL
jgi:hypothetical protein